MRALKSGERLVAFDGSTVTVIGNHREGARYIAVRWPSGNRSVLHPDRLDEPRLDDAARAQGEKDLADEAHRALGITAREQALMFVMREMNRTDENNDEPEVDDYLADIARVCLREVEVDAAPHVGQSPYAEERLSPDEKAAIDHVRNEHRDRRIPWCPICEPHSVGREVVSVRTIPGSEGTAYALQLPEGEWVTITEHDTDYHALAGIIDRAFPGRER